MSTTNFVDNTTVIVADWLNDTDAAIYAGIGTGTIAPTTPAEVRTNLGLSAVGGAALIGNTAAGTIAAVTVQAAINELDTEKEATANKSTTLVADLASDTKFPSVKAVYEWVVGFFVAKTSATGSAQIPSGTTAQRGTPPAYSLRGNSDYTKLEFTPDGTTWSGLGGATGAGGDDIFYENGQTITTDYTITTNKNAMTAGPITINSGITVTIPTGSTWSIV